MEYGGRGLGLLEQVVWFEEYARAGAPYVGACFVGLNHAGPTIIARGSQAQKTRHLPAILRGEVVWCQGFSEPEAGSDLASLRTRAELDGEDLVINGQKTWTSYAHVADRQELLVRTDGRGKKHQGITWVICDLEAPGITVRPIQTIAGLWHFCEVFYDDVRIPLTNVVGELDEGWSVAMATLSFERGTAFIADQMELAEILDELVGLAADRDLLRDEHIAWRIARLRAEVAAVRSMTYAGISRSRARGQPGPEASVTRLFFSELTQRVHALAMDLIGGDALEMGRWPRDWLRVFSATIGAGTRNIQRNIIAERVLGLPR